MTSALIVFVQQQPGVAFERLQQVAAGTRQHDRFMTFPGLIQPHELEGPLRLVLEQQFDTQVGYL